MHLYTLLPMRPGREPRAWQLEAREAALAGFARGYQSVLVSAATGTGKGDLIAGIMTATAWRGRRVLFLVHRRELVEDITDRVRAIEGAPRVGIVQGDRDEWDADIVCAMVQSCTGKRLQRCGHRDLVVTDECFVAGTPVAMAGGDDRPIEEVSPGDRVLALDAETGEMRPARVSRVSRRRTHFLCRIQVSGRPPLLCTAEHPFWARSGRSRPRWVPAHKLTDRHEVLDASELQDYLRRVRQGNWEVAPAPVTPAVLPGVPGQDEAGPAEGDHGELCPLRCTHPGHGEEGSMAGGERADVLRRQVPGCERLPHELGADGGDESAARLAPDEGAQPDGESGGARENGRDAPANPPPTGDPRGEWAPTDGRGAGCGRGPRLGDQRGGAHAPTEGLRLPVALQARRRHPRAEGGGGGGRELARVAGAEGTGREEGGVPRWARVDSVSVLQRGGPGRSDRGGLARDVFNLEVEGCHTYVAGGIVVHNCHHAVAPSYRAVYDHVASVNPSWKHLGLTATPFRSAGDGGTAGLGAVFDAVVYEHGIARAIEVGDLVPLRAWNVSTEVDLSTVAMAGGDFDAEQLARAVDVPARNDLVVDQYLERAPGQPALVFGASIDHAEHLAEAFRRRGIAAAAVSERTPEDARAELVATFRRADGSLPVLCSKDLLFEGFDAPATRLVLKARPTKSRVVFQQMVGRGLRLHPDKDECLFVDLVDNGVPLDLATAADLADDGRADTTARGLRVGDLVLRRHHEDWGTGEVLRVEPGAMPVCTVQWPVSRVHREGEELEHPAAELRRARPEEADRPVQLSLRPGALRATAYEVFLLPRERDAGVGWYAYQDTLSASGRLPGGARVTAIVVGKESAGAWVARRGGDDPATGAPLPPEVTQLRHGLARDAAVAFLQAHLQAIGAEVEPWDSAWRGELATQRQVNALRGHGIRRDCSQMSRGEASALIDAVTALREVRRSQMSPAHRARADWARKAYSKAGRGKGGAA